MRQVARGPVPVCLFDVAVETQRYAETGKIEDRVYRHPDVLSALKLMYPGKCFLCEDSTYGNGEVEHFLPHDRTCPDRAYAWSNLNWSCSACNARKKKKRFREPGKGPVLRTVLLDPSNPPAGHTIDSLLSFDKGCEAIGCKPTVSDDVALLVERTLEFLNDPTSTVSRLRRLVEMMNSLLDARCRDVWDLLSAGTAPIEISAWKPQEAPERLKALDTADAIYSGFLAGAAPFSTCMRACFFERFRVAPKDLLRMSDALRDHKGLQRLQP